MAQRPLSRCWRPPAPSRPRGAPSFTSRSASPTSTRRAHLVEAAIAALHAGHTHYTPAAGIPALRQAIADYIARTRGITVDPAQVVVVPGGKPIMFFVLLAMVEEGDEVIYPNPGFPIYESMIHFTGGKAGAAAVANRA